MFSGQPFGPVIDAFGNYVLSQQEQLPGIVEKVRDGDIASVKAKVKQDNVDVNKSHSRHGYTLPWFAFVDQQHDMLRYLVNEEGADINTRDSRRFNLLWFAIYQHRTIAEMTVLLDLGIDVNATMYDERYKINKSAMRYAIRYLEEERSLEICELLLSYGAVVTDEVHVAVRRQYPSVVARLIHAGAMPSIQVLDGPSEKTWIYKFFSSALDINGDRHVHPRMSPLDTALCHTSEEIVDLLLKKMFLLKSDLQLGPRFRNWKLDLIEELGRDIEAEDFCLQPWSLEVACFVQVSEILGFESKSNRQEKVLRIELPAVLKRKLMFEN